MSARFSTTSTTDRALIAASASQRAPSVLLARIFHTSRSRRREEAERSRWGTRPPPHVGGYGLSAFRAACEIFGLGGQWGAFRKKAYEQERSIIAVQKSRRCAWVGFAREKENMSQFARTRIANFMKFAIPRNGARPRGGSERLSRSAKHR